MSGVDEPVLVTGAAGMIGSEVVRLLDAQGMEVRAHLGPPGVTHDPLPSDVRTFVADMADRDTISEHLAGAQAVVHLAGPPSVPESFQRPAEFVRSHALGTATILELCRDHKIRRLVHISSAEVYGIPQSNPVPEGHPRQPRSPYGAAKLCAEDLVACLAPPRGMTAVVLRPFSVVGRKVQPHSVLGTILRQAMAGDDVQVFAPQVVRDYVDVRDVAGAVARALVVDLDDREVPVCNIGSGLGTPVANLGEMVLRMLGRDGRVRLADGLDRPAVADIVELVADVRHARELLGWEPAFTLDRTLQSIIADVAVS